MKKISKSAVFLFIATLASVAPVFSVSAQPAVPSDRSAMANKRYRIEITHPEKSTVTYQDAAGKLHKLRTDKFVDSYYKIAPNSHDATIFGNFRGERARIELQGRLKDAKMDGANAELDLVAYPIKRGVPRTIVLSSTTTTVASTPRQRLRYGPGYMRNNQRDSLGRHTHIYLMH